MAQRETEFEKAMARLAPKRAAFVREYLIDLNATQAAKRAGYSPRTSYSQGQRLLKDAEVQACLELGQKRKAERLDLTEQMIVDELAKIAFGSLANYLSLTSDGEPFIDMAKASEAQLAALSEAQVEDFVDGRGDDARDVRRVKIRMHDKRAALVDLGKHIGMFGAREEAQAQDALADLLREINRKGSKAPIATTTSQPAGKEVP